MKIALIQINPVIGDFDANSEKIKDFASKAKHEGCDLAIFPELAICGYPPQDLLERPSFIEDHEKSLENLINDIKGITVITGAITRHATNTGKPLHNSAICFSEGNVIGKVHKRLLPTYDVFDEARYFEPGGPCGPLNINGQTLSLSICEDIWNDKDASPQQLYDIDPLSELLGNGAQSDLLINIAASPFRHEKTAEKRRMFSSICRKYRIPMLYVNQVGGQDSLLFDGQSLVMDQSGNIKQMATGFAEDMIVTEIAELQEETPSRTDIPKDNEMADVYSALVMGTRDYLGKCGFKSGIVGLSGGIDSALTAAIAADALGNKNLIGVALPSRYSSPESVEDARQLATNLGIGFKVIPIEDIFQAQLATLQPILGELDQDITEQNLQARIRGNLLMAISNRHGSMLLSTGNKSELAVGYCTLYGDMSGGLAVISDVPKGMVYSLARFVNREKETIPLRTIEKPPSAELAPDQLDQDDLPPYEILDAVLKQWLEENKSVSEIISAGHDPAIVSDIIRRVKRNEYKRKQAPMGLKVTSKAFGYGRRYPTAENWQEKVT